MSEITMYHPALDFSIRVPERSVRVRERSGWIVIGDGSWESMTTAELRAELRAVGLTVPTRATKQQIIETLQDYYFPSLALAPTDQSLD